jgi:hypothetical protein
MRTSEGGIAGCAKEFRDGYERIREAHLPFRSAGVFAA